MNSFSWPASQAVLVLLAVCGGTACHPTHADLRLRELKAQRAGKEAQQQLLQRAGFDLVCPTDELGAFELDGSSYGVRGCGRQARYVILCGKDIAGQHRCEWVRQGEVISVEVVDAAPPRQMSMLAP